jgi:hypothetical protein
MNDQSSTLKWQTNDGDRMCACGHSRDRHYNGRGICAVRTDKARCICIRFRKLQPLTKNIEALRERERLTCGRLSSVTQQLTDARKQVRQLEVAYEKANAAYAEARARYVIARSVASNPVTIPRS